MLTLGERAASYARVFPQWPSSWPTVVAEAGREALQGVWMFGQDYRNKSEYYGAFPGNFLERLAALFPDFSITPGTFDFNERPVLHAFSGSLGPGPYTRLDLNAALAPEAVGSIYDVAALTAGVGPFSLIVADPPYSDDDANRYGAKMIDRYRATAALAAVAAVGGLMAWLDTCWPMHSKEEWVTVGRIYVQRSTNHRVRLLSLFERTA